MGEFAYYNGGAEKFEQFTRSNPDYYLYHGEIDHIAINRQAIALQIHDTKHAVIVGPGPASSFAYKDAQILELLPHLESVDCIDPSASFNRQAGQVLENMEQRLGRTLKKEFHVMGYQDAAKILTPKPHTTLITTGALICNVADAPLHGFPDHAMEDMLRPLRALIDDRGHAVVGYDANNDYFKLRAAYNQQVAPWLTNLPKIINDHCIGIRGFDPDPANFRYDNEWLPKASQMSHKLVVEKPQRFSIDSNGQKINVDLHKDDEFIIMPSLKPLSGRITARGENVGLDTGTIYQSRHGLVLHLFHAQPQSASPYRGRPTYLNAPTPG